MIAFLYMFWHVLLEESLLNSYCDPQRGSGRGESFLFYPPNPPWFVQTFRVFRRANSLCSMPRGGHDATTCIRPTKGHRETTNHCEKNECVACSLSLDSIDYVIWSFILSRYFEIGIPFIYILSYSEDRFYEQNYLGTLFSPLTLMLSEGQAKPGFTL